MTDPVHPHPHPHPNASSSDPSPKRGRLASQPVRFVIALIALAVVATAGVALVAGIAQLLVMAAASPNVNVATILALGHVALIAGLVLALVGVIRYGSEGFLAASWVFFPLVPPLAAAISVLTYLLAPPTGPAAQLPQDPIGAVYVGLASSVLLWMLSAFPGAQLARRQRAQRRVYDDLCQRFWVLSARVKAVCGQTDNNACKALAEARFVLAQVEPKLVGADGEGPALRWVLGNGYTSIARELHRVEEALFIVEEIPELIGDVLHDDLSLADSGLKNRFALRRLIRDAMPAISPNVADTLLRPVPPLPQTASLQLHAQADANRPTAFEAREALREVRFAINDYRDDIVDSFARGRNRLLWTYLMVSISTYVLLGLGMLSGIPRATLVAVSAMYMVGSLVGLFSRLRIEATRPSTNDDYGLYLARLLTGPLLSGLAGVAGVYLVAQAPTFIAPLAEVGSTAAAASPGPSASPTPSEVAAVAQAAPKALAEIYDLTRNNLALAIAAVFGLAPGLLTARLQQQVDRAERDLQRSEPATSSAVGGAPPDDSSGEGG